MKHVYNTIQELWEYYEKARIAPEASAFQRLEMRKAFFAGIAGYQSLEVHLLEDKNLSDEAMDKIYMSLAQEIADFFRLMYDKQGPGPNNEVKTS